MTTTITMTIEQYDTLRKTAILAKVVLEGNIMRFKTPECPIDLTELHTQWLGEVNNTIETTSWANVKYQDAI